MKIRPLFFSPPGPRPHIVFVIVVLASLVPSPVLPYGSVIRHTVSSRTISLTGAALAPTLLFLVLLSLPLKPTAAPPESSVSTLRYQTAGPNAVLTNRLLAVEMAERTRQTIAPTLHLVETDHFLIFSAWNPSNDPILSGLCEQMYQKLAQQFSVRAPESVWIGKCPIYVFWDPAHYARFISEIDQSRKLDPNMSRADGYHASRGLFSYVVINGVSSFGANLEQARIRFYYVLAHEGTHAFVHRYVSDRVMPVWVEEGLADYMAAVLVPQSTVNRTWLTATRSALHDPDKLRDLLRKKDDLTPTEYGLAQSVVRYLVRQSPADFIRFVESLKQGDAESTALQSAYHITNADLIRGWSLFWQRTLAVHI